MSSNEKPSLVPSKYQQAFYDEVLMGNGNIVLQATAGAAKTTSLVNAIRYIPYGKKILFVAFNRHSVQDLKERLPGHVDCFTMHSLGMRSIIASYPPESVKMKENKQIDYIMPLFEDEKSPKEKWMKIYETDDLLSKIRATMTKLTEDDVLELASHHNLYPDKQVVLAAITAGIRLKSYNLDNDRPYITIDFQDMIELCVLNKEIRMPQYDYVFVDEGADCSKLDQLFIERVVKRPRGRLIVAGDPRQSIYNFRGADIRSFEYFAQRPQTVKLPLSISYRCAKHIVRNAKKVYPEIEEWEQQQDGLVRKGHLSEVQDGDMVLSRNVRPLVDAFFLLLDQGKKATIVGKEIEKGLLSLLSSIPDDAEMDVVRDKLNATLRQKHQELAKYVTTPENHPKFIQLEEKVNVLYSLMPKCQVCKDMELLIERIFHDDSVAPIKLMTIHKSKGLESDRVFVIERYDNKTLIPSSYAVTPEQKEQEQNLKFVSYTRAKRELVLVELACLKNSEVNNELDSEES